MDSNGNIESGNHSGSIANDEGKQVIADWQKQINDHFSPAQRYAVLDDGTSQPLCDSRDALAAEMAWLKERKQTGHRRKQQITSNDSPAANHPQDRPAHTVSHQGSFFSAIPTSQANDLSKKHSSMETASSVYDSLQHSRYPTDSIYYSPSASEGLEHSSYYDSYANAPVYHTTASLPLSSASYRTKPMKKTRPVMKIILIILACLLFVGCGAFVAVSLLGGNTSAVNGSTAVVTLTLDGEGLVAHHILIPGKDGERITLRELRTSAIVTDGAASFTVSDHVWYDDYSSFLQDTMRVTLSPFIVSDNGQQTALPQIQYDIDIPLSSIELDTPSTPYQTVSTTLYNIVFYVQPGSAVTINGEDFSDLVDADTGKVSYNATVQPIGENVVTITSRSQYCRENQLDIILYREKQSIPIDLSSDIASTSSSGNGTMTVKGTTLPGAVVKVLSPHLDLDITETATNGNFSFVAKFDKIGNNTIVITVDYPGKETTRVEHIVNYVPNIDIYSRKAWDIVSMYQDLIDNIDLRKANTQIYVCTGEILSVDTNKPQRCFMNVGTEENPLVIYVENASKTTWEVGKRYRLYGDAYGMYDSKPWLIVRYTYDDKTNGG